MFEKLKEYWVEIISWIIGIAGIIATIVSLYISESEGMFVLYVLLLAFETILVLFGSLGLKYKYSFESEIDDLKDEIAEMGIAQSEMQEENKRKLLESQKCIGTVFSNLKNISKLHNDLCNRITVINENSYRILEVLEAAFTEDSASVKTEAVQAQVLSSYKDFANGMFDLYKRYTNQMLTCLVNMVEAYLKLRGHNQKVAATVKLFDEAFYESCGRREDITVYTAFRDKRTYDDRKEREIGLMAYTIDGNIDFSMCLSKDHFVINNAKKGSENYFNEHLDFEAYYNCAVVVAIGVKQADNTFKYLGYLCCDCLNKNGAIEVFDKEIAQLMYSIAQNYATFLETLESNWIDRVPADITHPNSFIGLIYDRTFKGKRK